MFRQGPNFSLRVKPLFEISEVEITRVNCMCMVYESETDREREREGERVREEGLGRKVLSEVSVTLH